MNRGIKLILFTLICVTNLSCKNDDNTNNNDTNPIIGEWLRSDYTVDTSIEYKIHFIEEGNNGMTTTQVTTVEGITSSLDPFKWSIDNNLLELQFGGQTIVTTYEFLDNGNLFLEDFSEHEFIRQ